LSQFQNHQVPIKPLQGTKTHRFLHLIFNSDNDHEVVINPRYRYGCEVHSILRFLFDVLPIRWPVCKGFVVVCATRCNLFMKWFLAVFVFEKEKNTSLCFYHHMPLHVDVIANYFQGNFRWIHNIWSHFHDNILERLWTWNNCVMDRFSPPRGDGHVPPPFVCFDLQ